MMDCFYCKQPMKKATGEYPTAWGDTVLMTQAEWWECNCKDAIKMFTFEEVRRLQEVARKAAEEGEGGMKHTQEDYENVCKALVTETKECERLKEINQEMEIALIRLKMIINYSHDPIRVAKAKSVICEALAKAGGEGE